MTETLTPTSFAGLRVEKPRHKAPLLNVLIFGDYGMGKTRLCGSCDELPEMRKVLFVDIEGGLLTLRSTWPDVDAVRVTTWRELVNVYNHLYAGGHEYSTVVLDSITEIQKLNMADVMEVMLSDPKNAERDPDIPSLHEWGKNAEQMRRLIRKFRDLPMNVLMTALMKEDKDPMSGALTKRPDLPGKLAGQVPAFFDEVWYLYVREVPVDPEDPEKGKRPMRLLATGAHNNVVAKDRSGALPSIVADNPTMAKLYPLITGGKK